MKKEKKINTCLEKKIFAATTYMTLEQTINYTAYKKKEIRKNFR